MLVHWRVSLNISWLVSKDNDLFILIEHLWLIRVHLWLLHDHLHIVLLVELAAVVIWNLKSILNLKVLLSHLRRLLLLKKLFLGWTRILLIGIYNLIVLLNRFLFPVRFGLKMIRFIMTHLILIEDSRGWDWAWSLWGSLGLFFFNFGVDVLIESSADLIR